jgi:hypothetical protein
MEISAARAGETIREIKKGKDDRVTEAFRNRRERTQPDDGRAPPGLTHALRGQRALALLPDALLRHARAGRGRGRLGAGRTGRELGGRGVWGVRGVWVSGRGSGCGGGSPPESLGRAGPSSE